MVHYIDLEAECRENLIRNAVKSCGKKKKKRNRRDSEGSYSQVLPIMEVVKVEVVSDNEEQVTLNAKILGRIKPILANIQ